MVPIPSNGQECQQRHADEMFFRQWTGVEIVGTIVMPKLLELGNDGGNSVVLEKVVSINEVSNVGEISQPGVPFIAFVVNQIVGNIQRS
jgi:hypothetical protein